MIFFMQNLTETISVFRFRKQLSQVFKRSHNQTDCVTFL